MEIAWKWYGNIVEVGKWYGNNTECGMEIYQNRPPQLKLVSWVP